MIIDVKYNLGDNIRYIERKRHVTYGPCPCCNQVGEIIGVDGKNMNVRIVEVLEKFLRE